MDYDKYKPMIKLSNITKVFQQGNRTINALNGVSLDVPAGQIYGVIGSSGAGKSTLIRCVNLLERPTTGSVLVDGQDLMAMNASQLTRARRQIGMIFQHFNLLASRTVFGNVALPLELNNTPKAAIEQRVNELLELVGLADKRDAWPANLSGGQKQRVAIARALASSPKVLLCDEATSALDPATTRAILELLKDINRRLGLTILLITHEMDVVKRICDRVAVISNGELIEQDTVSAVFSHPKTPLAQQFIQSTLHLDIPDDYAARLKTEPCADSVPLLRLEFTGQSVDAPLLSETTRRFNVNNNIISAQMDYAGGVKFGIMLTEMHGTQESTQAAIEHLQEHQVKVEVLGYV
ncbi:methionine import ATP-binding protein MetN [Salmonella enterica subsp. enterica serovar Choleraesuis]|nr:methionine import ATP-binding protein MetN [Salmonella enterica subsp. enterica serovar Choleraesuis]